MKSLISVTVLLWSWIGFISAIQKRATSVCETDSCKETAHYLLNAIDQTQDPCTDFYQFACGGFIAKNPLPKYTTEYGTPDVLYNNALELVQHILETPNTSNTPAIINAQALYNTCLEQEYNVNLLKSEIELLGGWPITSPIQQANINSLEVILAKLALRGTNAIISSTVGVDLENSNQYIIEADFGKLPLDKSLFGNENDLQACIKYATSSAEVLGASNSDVTTNQINEMLQFGKQLANIIPTPDVIANFTKIYKNMTIAQLQQLTDPSGQIFNWLTYYNTLFSLELTSSEVVVAYDSDYLVSVMQIIKSTNKNTLVNYAMCCFVEDYTWHAGGALLQLHVTEAEALTGETAVEPRNTTCTKFANKVFGYALAKPYVANAFPASNIEKVLEIAQLVQSDYVRGLATFNLFDATTKSITEKKVAAMKFLIGYPTWINDDLAVANYYRYFPEMINLHFTNAINSITSLVEQQLQLLHKPVDTSQFDFIPSAAQPTYEYNYNAITLPAGLLPYYTAGQLQALDLGALGSLVGSLINDGINNIGSQFDLNGNMVNGWPPNVQEAVANDVQCLINQFNGYCSSTYPTECMNGTDIALNIVGEMVGTLGVYKAYNAWLSTNPQEQQLPGLEKYTSQQLLFINFAQRHCYSNTPANIRNAIRSDPQFLQRYTVIGVLANIPEFAQTFQCSLGLMNRGNDSCTDF